MSDRRRGLGRGLGALIPAAPQATDHVGPRGRRRDVTVAVPRAAAGARGGGGQGGRAADASAGCST